MEKLIREYRDSVRKLRGAKVKPLYCVSMISDAEFAIAYMETGNIPGTRWAVARHRPAKMEVPVDPMVMASIVRDREPVAAAPAWVVDFLDRLMLTLTALEKDAYQLVRGRGYSYGQAAHILKCTRASVQSYVCRADRKIQSAVRNIDGINKVEARS